MKRVVVRADASPEIGSGHVMRCLALAEWLEARGAAVHFVLAEGAEAFGRRILDLGHGLTRLDGILAGGAEDAERTAALVGARVVVVDGYQFDDAYQRRLRAATGRLVQIDDLAQAIGVADVVVNHGLQADSAVYRAKARPGARLLLGPRYALLRPEFVEARRRAGAESAPRRRLLVTMGGADRDDVTGRLVEAVLASPDLPPATVVVGAAYPYLARLRARVAAVPERVALHVDVARMSDFMLDATLAVCAGGGTAWELCCLGVPMLVAVLADNQRPIAAALVREGAALGLGDQAALDEERLVAAIRQALADRDRLAAMGDTARALVDGEGGARVADAILNTLE